MEPGRLIHVAQQDRAAQTAHLPHSTRVQSSDFAFRVTHPFGENARASKPESTQHTRVRRSLKVHRQGQQERNGCMQLRPKDNRK